MAANLLEQKPVIKFLVADNCKPCEEWVMCMEKHVLVKKYLQMSKTWI